MRPGVWVQVGSLMWLKGHANYSLCLGEYVSWHSNVLSIFERLYISGITRYEYEQSGGFRDERLEVELNT